jgi:hypothetical protein
MHKIVSSQVSDVSQTEAQIKSQPATTAPIELDFSVLSHVGGAGPHGSWSQVAVTSSTAVQGPHGSW